MDEIILSLNKIEKSFSGTKVLNGINLDVQKGEFVTLLGPSGCGKTTTLRIISGLERPDAGRVLLEGADVTNTEPNRRDVNTVFQNYALFPHMTIAQNIAYSLTLKRTPKADIKEAVESALILVQLPGFENRMPHELSGGQKQRVAIARAIVNQPKILLLDEPLGALDLQLRRQMQIELKRLQKQLGITFIYITHDQEEALNMSDRIAVMRSGNIEQYGTPAEIYDKPRTAYVADFVGNANLITGIALGIENGVLYAEGEGGRFAVTAGGPVAAGTAITAAVRSEQIEILPAGENTAGITGKVFEKSFAGGMLRISVQLPGGTEVIVSRHGINSALLPGEDVRLSWAPQHAVLVEGEAAHG